MSIKSYDYIFQQQQVKKHCQELKSQFLLAILQNKKNVNMNILCDNPISAQGVPKGLADRLSNSHQDSLTNNLGIVCHTSTLT